MKRLSRHTLVVLLVALGVCLAGMSVAVVAFGQSSGDPDATVPLGDYTSTTTSPYTNTTTSPTTSPYTTTQPQASTTTVQTVTTPTDTGQSAPATTNGTKPSRTHGSRRTPGGGTTRTVPSTAKATRPGPTHLAFTGGEPILVGVAGAGLMLAGLGLHRRRQRRAA
jgi:cytoskeletal protein RodZ